MMDRGWATRILGAIQTLLTALMFGSIALVVLVAYSDSKSEANLTVAPFDTSLCRWEFDILVRYPWREQLIGENGAPIDRHSSSMHWHPPPSHTRRGTAQCSATFEMLLTILAFT